MTHRASTETAKQVHVVCWKYRDNSAFGIVGYSPDQKEAEFVKDLLTEHGDSKEFYCVVIDSLESPS